MNLYINGVAKSIETNQKLLTLKDVIEKLGHHPQTIVVEFNGNILRPNLWNDQPVKDGDTLEIVTIVGGGS